jgi:hypothetical protein
VLTTADGEPFTGELAPPVFQDPATVDQYIAQDVISVIEVGNQDQHIQIGDGSGNDLNATLRMPVPRKQAGDQIEIYSSEDGVNFNYLTTATVQDIQGDPYVVFSTDHFSVFVTAAIN